MCSSGVGPPARNQSDAVVSYAAVLLPLLLIALATGAAAIIAYGTHPGLAHHARGLEIIMLTRRIEWPLVMLSLVLCMVLLGLVITNKRRAWWLIGLAPVLALFVHRFGPARGHPIYILDSPQFVEAQSDFAPRDDWWVVGLVFEEQAYALPYWALYNTPLVFLTDYDKRMVVMWSARANRAMAFRVTREFKARDLEFVNTTVDSPLIYDRRLGQFIVALTGRTVAGAPPVGLDDPIPTQRTTWSHWRAAHPNSKVLRGYESSGEPLGPVLPSNMGSVVEGIPAETRIALIATTPPSAIPVESLAKFPVNIVAGSTRLLIDRNPVTGALVAFDRNVKEDLFPTFTARSDRRRPALAWMDSDTGSLWARDGKAIDGPLKDAQLKSYPVEHDLYWGVMKYWDPSLQLAR